MNQQIKTKDRVRDLGEVYTNKREVNAMLDLVKDESYKISSRFLEPACGNGNFLVEILSRKLVTVKEKYKSQKEFEYNIIKSLSSIYGIDICNDNVIESRERLLVFIKSFYSSNRNTTQANNGFYETVDYILSKNIIHGDTLNGQEHIVFSEFKKISDDNYALSESRFPYLELLKTNNKQIPTEVFSEKNYLELHINGVSNEV